ncbi:hypothetical protein [Kocuria kalidii]|uniref:hypothetical protein n=1 Tax=Kocuria kalidii TaxID=3376283 RepID=UPI0037B94E1F
MEAVVFGLGFQGFVDPAIVECSVSHGDQQKRGCTRHEAQKHMIFDEQEHRNGP